MISRYLGLSSLVLFILTCLSYFVAPSLFPLFFQGFVLIFAFFLIVYILFGRQKN